MTTQMIINDLTSVPIQRVKKIKLVMQFLKIIFSTGNLACPLSLQKDCHVYDVYDEQR